MFAASSKPADSEALVTTRFHVDVRDIEGTFRSHVLVIWVIIPSLVALGALSFSGQRILSVTCEDGFDWWVYLFIVAILLYHCKVENDLWRSVYDFLTKPEMTIARHYHLPAKIRRTLRILSAVEVVNLFTDFMFPFIAFQCSPLTSVWVYSWENTSVPWASFAAGLIKEVGLWGLSATCIMLSFIAQFAHAFWTVTRPFLNRQRLQIVISKRQPIENGFSTQPTLLSGLTETARFLSIPVRGRSDYAEVANARHDYAFDHVRAKLAGEQFAVWSAGAQCCIFPSVAALCDHMSDGRRWKIDFRRATNLTEEDEISKRRDAIEGREEFIDRSEFLSVYAHSVRRFWSCLLFHILLGPMVALYLQVTFFGLAFDVTTVEAKVKLLISITASLITLLHRSRIQVGLMFNSMWIMLFVLFVLTWVFVCVMKLYYAYQCPSHVWNVTRGCVPERATKELM